MLLVVQFQLYIVPTPIPSQLFFPVTIFPNQWQILLSFTLSFFLLGTAFAIILLNWYHEYHFTTIQNQILVE